VGLPGRCAFHKPRRHQPSARGTAVSGRDQERPDPIGPPAAPRHDPDILLLDVRSQFIQIRDPRLPDAVKDIVVETASARYQDAIDRFVRGDDVPDAVVRKAWEEHTVPNSLGAQAEEFIRAVRAVNASLAGDRKLRVLAGDPPIDWENVTSGADRRRWTEQRDTYPADIIRRLVLERGRRALLGD
jgi:hypothetical protein